MYNEQDCLSLENRPPMNKTYRRTFAMVNLMTTWWHWYVKIWRQSKFSRFWSYSRNRAKHFDILNTFLCHHIQQLHTFKNGPFFDPPCRFCVQYKHVNILIYRDRQNVVCTGFLTNNTCGINIQFTSCFNILCHHIGTSLSSTMNNKLWLLKQ